jgi:hypothetical protein
LDLDHPLRLVDADYLCTKLVADSFRQLTFAAADLQDSLRLCVGDGSKDELARIVALCVLVGGLSCSEILLRRVLRAYELSVVDWRGHPRATFRSGDSSSTISSRIFSSERRIRRETCICEMPTC